MDPTRALGSRRVATRRELLSRGATPSGIAAAVHRGTLMRVRRGHYALPSVERRSAEAVRIGGLLGCVSAADEFGIWVPQEPFTHVAMRHSASRMRSPRNRFVPLGADNRDGCTLHWWPLTNLDAASGHSVSVVDSLAQIIRCQPPEIAVAALDSALNQGKLSLKGLDRLFMWLPEKFAQLRQRVDSRAMSGIETIVRLLVLDAGLRCELQVPFDGVGDVDLVIEGCIVVETDGRQNHEGPLQQARDYDRDMRLAARGYIVLRFNYRQVMFHPDEVMAAIRGALRVHRRFTP